MILNQITKINEVRKFIIHRGDCYYILSNEPKLIGPGLELAMDEVKKTYSFSALDDYLIWPNGRGRTLVLDLRDNAYVLDEGDSEGSFHVYPFFIDGKFACSKSLSGEDVSYFSIDPVTGKREALTDKIQSHFFSYEGKTLFFKYDISSDRNLYCYDVSGRQLWSHEVSGEYQEKIGSRTLQHKVGKIFGAYKGLVWLRVEGKGVVGLDIDTGKQLHFIEDSWAQVLDEKRGELVQLSGDRFSRSDLNLEVPIDEVYDITTTVRAHGTEAGFSSAALVFTEKYICFGFYDLAKVGVFDRNTHEVVYSFDLDTQSKGINMIRDLKIDGNKWYVLDMFGVLHILECDELMES